MIRSAKCRMEVAEERGVHLEEDYTSESLPESAGPFQMMER